jgi:hypothetical protein
MNGQPNQGGIAQLAGGMGSMGGSPTLGGAPQTPPMPQGGAQKPPQQAPQGGLPPDLLKALAAAKVKKMQDAAKRELELQMAQQQAASGEGNKTVVQQLQEGVEKNTAQEMMQALSGGLKQAGQMSAQAQGQPMSGGIASAPGANQAAQPEAMAAGGIVAFDEGGMARGAESLYVDSLGNAMTREEAERAGKPKLLRDLSGADYYVDEDGNVRSKAETKERFNPRNRNLPVVVDQPLERNLPSTDVRREIKDVGSSSTARKMVPNTAPTQYDLGAVGDTVGKAGRILSSPAGVGIQGVLYSGDVNANEPYQRNAPTPGTKETIAGGFDALGEQLDATNEKIKTTRIAMGGSSKRKSDPTEYGKLSSTLAQLEQERDNLQREYEVAAKASNLGAVTDKGQIANPTMQRNLQGGIPAALNQGKPGNMDDPALVRREDMRRGIANVQRPPVAAAQAQRPAAIQQPSLNIQTNPNYAPPAAAGDAGGLSGLMTEQLIKRIGAKPEDAEAAAIKKYKDLMAVDPELAAQLKADTAAERAALQARSTREPSVYDRLRAFADVAPAGGQTWTMAGAKGAGNVNRLEKEYEADRMAALSGLKGLSKAEYDKQQGEKEKLFGVGTAANKTALESIDKAMTNATQLLNTQSVAEAARQQNVSLEKIAANRLLSEERIAAMREKAIKDSRVIPLAEQMNAELIKADTEEKRNAIVARYSQITDALKPSQAAIRGEDKLIQMAFEAWLGSKAGRDATPAQIRDKMKELRETDGDIPSTPPAGAVRKVP